MTVYKKTIYITVILAGLFVLFAWANPVFAACAGSGRWEICWNDDWEETGVAVIEIGGTIEYMPVDESGQQTGSSITLSGNLEGAPDTTEATQEAIQDTLEAGGDADDAFAAGLFAGLAVARDSHYTFDVYSSAEGSITLDYVGCVNPGDVTITTNPFEKDPEPTNGNGTPPTNGNGESPPPGDGNGNGGSPLPPPEPEPEFELLPPPPANNPPSSTNHQAVQGDNCGVASPPIALSWTFTDPDGHGQSAYQVKIKQGANTIYSPGKISSSSKQYSPPLGTLSYNTTYTWELKVWDDYSSPVDSGWITAPAFTTPAHQYPSPSFTWFPQIPETNEAALFTDTSAAYGGSAITFWQWTFEDGTPSSPAQQNPSVLFSSIGSKAVTLQVTDSSGFSCSASPQGVGVGVPFPEWEEIPPFGARLYDFLAGFFYYPFLLIRGMNNKIINM